MKIVNKPIDVIAYCNKDGDIEPIRIRLDEKVIRIERILARETEKLCGNYMEKFTCTSTINNVEKMFEIKYELKTHKWILFKI
ncbi:MAG: hypothetical protein E7H86_08965 [Bifidobacterium breve]|nr:hypothetical protein [Bifidobacterium breve]